MSTDPLNGYYLEANCENALKTCNFLSSSGENCASQFCFGFPATSGTCPQIGLDPQNCCSSSDPATCLNNWVHNGGGATPNVCASVVSIIAECSSEDPSLFPSSSIYTSGPQATALAQCMCYDSDGTYDPDYLDNFAAECSSSGSAAHPTYYPYGSRLVGFCTNNAGPASAAPSTTPPAAVASTTVLTFTKASTLEGASATTQPAAPSTTSEALSSTTQASTEGVSSAVSKTTSKPLLGSSVSSASTTSSSPATTTSSSASSKSIKLQMSVFLFFGFSIVFNLA